MSFGKRGWLVQSFPLALMMMSLKETRTMVMHGGMMCCEDGKGSVKHALTRLSVKWTGTRKYLL